jgi:hypothetical protein
LFYSFLEVFFFATKAQRHKEESLSLFESSLCLSVFVAFLFDLLKPENFIFFSLFVQTLSGLPTLTGFTSVGNFEVADWGWTDLSACGSFPLCTGTGLTTSLCRSQMTCPVNRDKYL